jgi:hypothetical protein
MGFLSEESVGRGFPMYETERRDVHEFSVQALATPTSGNPWGIDMCIRIGVVTEIATVSVESTSPLVHSVQGNSGDDF